MSDQKGKAAEGSSPKNKEDATNNASTSTTNAFEGLSAQDLRKQMETVKRDLRAHLDRKKKIDRELATLEASIYAFEGSYLSDNLFQSSSGVTFGNIIKGYDAYLKAPPSTADRKRARGYDEPRDSDRMFSRSSATFQKVCSIPLPLFVLTDIGQALDLRQPVAVATPSQDFADSQSEDESASSAAGGRKKRRM